MKTLKWSLFGFFAIGVGLYPLAYVLADMKGGLLSSKPAEVLANPIWYAAFYLHILPGGLALLVGWTQFSQKLRNKRMGLHRKLGFLYILMVMVSGLAGLFIALYATGGSIAQVGFALLAISWLFTTTMALKTVKAKDIRGHEHWMIRSYALCFAAVTLRIWLPLFTGALGMDFITAYLIIAWLCWVPNLAVAEMIVRRKRRASMG